MTGLVRQLEQIVPDLSDQYTSWSPTGDYYRLKLRGQHAFQISLALDAIDGLDRPAASLTVADIGDSSGNHCRYLRALRPGLATVGVNLDPVAVAKITAKGLMAIQCRAEEVGGYGIAPDLFITFQMVEHLPDPVGFLRRLATGTKVRRLVITVPYRARSRVALQYIRQAVREAQGAERTHIFELSPDDWKPLFRFAGWDVVAERIYYQYPRRGNPLRTALHRRYWRAADFEGFYGVILRRDETWAALYRDWTG